LNSQIGIKKRRFDVNITYIVGQQN